MPGLQQDPVQAAEAIITEVHRLPKRDTPSIRALRRKRSTAWKAQPPDFIIGVALALVERQALRWVGYELIRAHRGAFDALDDRILAKLADGLDSWDTVDAFGCTLSGPAWGQGQASDALIDAWSRSQDRWLRRAALVSTVPLNMPRHGGQVDPGRTLAICERLADDRDDMVVKAMSWALRALCVHDAASVRAFLAAQGPRLAARVRREVGNKLRTGLKTPRAAAKS
jgi:3-methyladenine DNA glycosylase AlkD